MHFDISSGDTVALNNRENEIVVMQGRVREVHTDDMGSRNPGRAT